MRVCKLLSATHCIVLRRGGRRGTVVETSTVPKQVVKAFLKRDNKDVPFNCVRALEYNEFDNPFWLARVVGRISPPQKHLSSEEAGCEWFNILWVDTRYRDPYPFPAIDIAQNLIDEFVQKEKALLTRHKAKRKRAVAVEKLAVMATKRQRTSYQSAKQLQNPTKAKIREVVLRETLKYPVKGARWFLLEDEALQMIRLIHHTLEDKPKRIHIANWDASVVKKMKKKVPRYVRPYYATAYDLLSTAGDQGMSYRSLWIDGQSACSPGQSGQQHAEMIRMILDKKLIAAEGGVLLITFCTRFNDWCNPDKGITAICISEMYRIFDEALGKQGGPSKYRLAEGKGSNLCVYKHSRQHAQMCTVWFHLKWEPES